MAQLVYPSKTRYGLWILVSILSVMIGLYPAIYLFIDRKFGLLSSKSEALLANVFWNVGFYVHIMLGGIALLIGWFQFNAKLRNRNLVRHRLIGKVYVACALVSAIAGVGIGFYATGGFLNSLGFIGLGVTWFFTTLMALLLIRRGDIDRHQKFMIYSYAACFAAVTLRIWLPILVAVFGNFETAYAIVAWLCWVPNILVAYLITARMR